jgi:hypothetical protein
MFISSVLSGHKAAHDRVARLLVRLDHAASRIVNTDHGIK